MRRGGIGKRELSCYVYYNECVQVYDRTEAKDKLNALNESFPIPLKTGEIKALVRGIDKAKNEKNQINCYILTNKRIIEMLDISETEQAQLMFYPRMLGTPDKNRARDTRRKLNKESRDKKILELAKQGVKKVDIAKQVGCSPRTVYSVIVASSIKKCEVLKECINEVILITKEQFINYIKEAIKSIKKAGKSKENNHNYDFFSGIKPAKMEDKIYYTQGLRRSVGIGKGFTIYRPPG